MTEDILKKWLSQVRRGSLELCILGLIRQGDTYAFAMIQALERLDGFVLTEGAIYPLLKRLQNESLVETYWVESESGPPRKYYKLTAHGETLLDRMVDEWQKFSHFVSQTLERNSHDDDSSSRSSTPKVPLNIKETTADSAP